MNKIFICYSQKDIISKQRLETHLKVFVKQGQLDFWSDEQINAGEDWDPEILRSINESNAAILLISTEFLASDYIQDRELPLIFQKRQKEGMKVFPFILFPCNWQEHKTIPKINARPKSGKPLSSFKGKNDKEAVLSEFTLEIKTIIGENYVSEINDAENQQVKTKLPLIDKLKKLSNRFFPLSVLKQNTIPDLYPFNENLNPRHSQYINRFNLQLANDEITESLKKWNDTQLSKTSEDAKEVFSFLQNNLINSISGISVKEFKIHHAESKCQCSLCILDNLDLELLDKRMNSNNLKTNSSIQDKLEKAYLKFKTLNLKDAYLQLIEILNSVSIEQENDKRIITQFICRTNLQNLYWLYRNARQDAESRDILIELKNQSPYQFLSEENIDEQVKIQLEYIYNGKFIKDISYKIDKALIEIRKSVDVNRNVQFHIEELIYHIAYLYSFIRKNYLFYDLYDDFRIIAEKSIDGIFAAYSVQENIPPNSIFGSYMKININEFLLNLCTFYCDTKNLIYIFDHVFENLLFLISASVNNPKTEELFSAVVNLLKHSNSRFSLTGFKHLLAEKRNFIKHDDLLTLLDIALKKHKYDEDLLNKIVWIWEQEYPKQKISDIAVIQEALESENKKAQFFLWFISTDTLRKKIQNEILKSLKSKFSFANYIDCSLNKIISYDLYFSNALEYVVKSNKKGLYEKVGNSYITDDYNNFNYLIQLIYTFNIEIPKEYLAVFEQYSDYHKFLLNPEGFEYSNFKVEWLFVFQRKVYWEKFRKIEELKKVVSNELDKSFSNELAEIFHKHLK
jgi:hypothetical protein